MKDLQWQSKRKKNRKSNFFGAMTFVLDDNYSILDLKELGMSPLQNKLIANHNIQLNLLYCLIRLVRNERITMTGNGKT